MKFPHVVVDGSNIATEGRDLPSLAQLDEAVTSFLSENEVDLLTVVVDATFGHRIQPDERPLYETAIRANEIITPPAGVVGRGDTFVLQVANRANATVLSNDSFQEFHGTYEWLFEDNRLIGGKPIPGLGWVFVPRIPVRGAISRKAVQDAKKAKRKGEAAPLPGGERDRERDRERRRDRKRGEPEPSKSTSKETGRDRLRAEPKAPKNKQDRPSSQERGNHERGNQGGSKQDRVKQERQPRQGKPATAPTEFINAFLPFIDFVGAHAVGTTVNGVVERFTSHGAYLDVGGVRCYVPLKSLGSPTPRSARDVLDMGGTYVMRVETIDTPRRGIDVTIVEHVVTAPTATPGTETASTNRASTTHAAAGLVDEDRVESGDSKIEPTSVSTPPTRTKRTRPIATDNTSTATKTTRVRKATTRTPSTDTTVEADHIAEEAQVTPAKKTAAKKATAKKAPAKKAAAKKAVVKKAAVKKAAVKKAAVKKAAVKKAAVKKAPAKKAAAKKAPAKKAAAKKAPAKKAAKKK